MRASFDVSLGILNNETAALAQSGFLIWAKRFNAMPTTFHLRPHEVDELREMAGRMLIRAPEFHGFLDEMQSDESARTAPGANLKAKPADVLHR